MVWDLSYPLLEATPKVYIEGSFSGHKAIPGTYTISLAYGEITRSTTVEILPNPKYSTTQQQYEEYHAFMLRGEANYNEMTRMTNKMYASQKSLAKVLNKIDSKKHPELFKEAKATLSKIIEWDKRMVQRLAQAYDDVENFVNGFTAEYIMAINKTESDIPKVNKGSKAKIKELDQLWKKHKNKAEELQESIQELNTSFFEIGIGAIAN